MDFWETVLLLDVNLQSVQCAALAHTSRSHHVRCNSVQAAAVAAAVLAKLLPTVPIAPGPRRVHVQMVTSSLPTDASGTPQSSHALPVQVDPALQWLVCLHVEQC